MLGAARAILGTLLGIAVYFRLPALERLDGGPGTADSIWLKTAGARSWSSSRSSVCWWSRSR
jgi:hypothetical protein